MSKLAAISVALLSLGASAPRPAVRASFLYPLADSTGKMSFGWTSLAWDQFASELYVLGGGSSVVDVFNDNGMAVYSFGDVAGFGAIQGVAVQGDGNLLVLSTQVTSWAITRCNFRGDPIGPLAVRDLPRDFAADFWPNAIYATQAGIYLADKSRMKVAVVGQDGGFVRSWDLMQLVQVEESKRADGLMRGFSVDREGTMYFTIASLFSGYVVGIDGQVRRFGTKGSVPGRFNVAGGIVADEDGHVFVADTLRCAVLVFDRESLQFLGEFGSCGRSAGGLVNPLDVAVGNGRVYVTQSVGAVKAFAVLFE